MSYQIQDLIHKENSLPKPVYFTWSVLAFLDNFSLSDEEKIALLSVKESQSFLSGYRKYKSLLQLGFQALKMEKKNLLNYDFLKQC